MNDLNQISHALAHRPLNATTFERCAQDLLQRIYPHLNPIHGGSDWGRDADIPDLSGKMAPTRVLVTSSRTLAGVRDNQRTSIESMHNHDVEVRRVILVNPAILTNLDRIKLVESAGKQGVSLDPADIYDGTWIESHLRRDGYWRHQLLGLTEGSITLAPTAPELAESPWKLALQGRNEDLATLAAGPDDVVLTGKPGVGKSRLASELPGVAFVDKDANIEHILDDLRYTQPPIVVVDDAAHSLPLIRRLITARVAEPDINAYRLICMTWPDGLDHLKTAMPRARVQELDLLERQLIDAMLQEMGISNTLARAEILNQAEGRPGWAVALGDLLIRSHDATTLLNGTALIGKVKDYLIRASITESTADLLAVIAALGGVRDTETQRLAEATGVDRATIARSLDGAARSGLLDLHVRYDFEAGAATATRLVRPPMLALALAAERIFDSSAPFITFDELSAGWPDHAIGLAVTAVHTSRLGSPSARAAAERAMTSLLADQTIPTHALTELVDYYALLDASAGDRALVWLQRQLAVTDPDSSWLRDRLLEVVAHIAGRHRHASALDTLFDAVAGDTRPPNSDSGHPLRLIETMIRGYHPDLPRDDDIRRDIAARLRDWGRGDPAKQGTAAQIIAQLLDIQVEGAYADPADPMKLNLYSAVLPAALIPNVLDDQLPLIEEQLNAGGDALLAVLMDTAEAWLRIGSNFDHPFGGTHPADSIAAARGIGTRLLQMLSERHDLSRGYQARARSIGSRHDIDMHVEIADELEPFFRDLDRTGNDDPISALANLETQIALVVSTWTARPPGDVASMLDDLRAELREARLNYPDRLRIAAQALADHVDNPLEWLDNFEAHDLQSESFPLIRSAASNGLLREDRARRLLASPSQRTATVSTLMAILDPPAWAGPLLAEQLTKDDIGTIETALVRDELTPSVRELLLTDAEFGLRGLVGLAVVQVHVHNGRPWDEGRSGEQVLQALRYLELESLPRIYFSPRLALQEIIDRHPQLAADMFKAALARRGVSAFQHPGHDDVSRLLSRLPAEVRTDIWRLSVDNGSSIRLLGQLMGHDLQWAANLIDSHDATVEQVLTALGRMDAKPRIAAIADVLVPRGAHPEAVADLRSLGIFSGSQSENHQAAVDEFQSIIDASPSRHARRVAEAGIVMFMAARDKAAAAERLSRIRGEL